MIFIDKLWNGHNLIPLRLKRLYYAWQSGRRIFRSIMEQYDGAGFHLRGDPLNDLFWRRIFPVQAVNIRYKSNV